MNDVKLRLMTTSVILILIVLSLMLTSQSVAIIDPKSAIGIWLLDEGKGQIAKDASGNGNDGNFFGAVQWDKGQFGTAVKFGGGADYIRVPHSDKLSLTTFTLTAWLLTKSGGNWIGVISKSHNNQTRNYTLYIHKDSNTASISIGDEAANSWHDTSGKTMVNDGKWHHVAISFDDRTDIGKVFTDGLQEGQYNVANKVPQNNADLVFAAWHHAGGNSGFIGMLDEIAIFKVALEEVEVKEIMQKGLKAALSVSVEPKNKVATRWGEVKASKNF